MSEGQQHKKIAHIYEEEQVFITDSGCLYGYEKNNNGTYKCRRLNALEIRRFLYRMKTSQTEIMLVPQGRNVKRRLPRKFEDSMPLGY
jgi:hypothetical protein